MNRIAALIPVTALLLISLSVSEPSAHAAAKPCTVAIYFTVPISSTRIAAVRLRLKSDPQVKAFRFVSRAEALEELRERNPELVANLDGNPLPASFRVQLRSSVRPDRFVARYRRLKLPGVDEIAPVGLSSPCHAG